MHCNSWTETVGPSIVISCSIFMMPNDFDLLTSKSTTWACPMVDESTFLAICLVCQPMTDQKNGSKTWTGPVLDTYLVTLSWQSCTPNITFMCLSILELVAGMIQTDRQTDGWTAMLNAPGPTLWGGRSGVKRQIIRWLKRRTNIHKEINDQFSPSLTA